MHKFNDLLLFIEASLQGFNRQESKCVKQSFEVGGSIPQSLNFQVFKQTGNVKTKRQHPMVFVAYPVSYSNVIVISVPN